MPENTDSQKLNPRIREVEIGTRILRTIKLYPLAFSDELKFKDVILDIMNKFVQTVVSVMPEDTEVEGLSFRDVALFAYNNPALFGDEKLISFVGEQIEKKINDFLKLSAADENVEDLLQEMDNYQITEAAGIIFEQNFMGASKNARSLVQTMKEVFQWTRLSPESANITDTDLKISTLNDSKKEG